MTWMAPKIFLDVAKLDLGHAALPSDVDLLGVGPARILRDDR